MANLASMIMEGSMYGFSRANLTHSYDHEDGACLIAMESAEALRDIFEAEFYIPNSCTIQAALEGASCVEESSQAAIMEASVKGAFTKIKEFFIKLKEKVKEFLHNIKRYLLGIFGNDEKWVDQYESELKALKSDQLKGYKIKMYEYTHIAIADLKGKSIGDNMIALAQKRIDIILDDRSKRYDKDNFDDEKVSDEFEKEYDAFVKYSGFDPDEDIDKQIWDYYRNDAGNENGKEEVEVNPSFIKKCIDTIKKASNDVNGIDGMLTKTEEAYKKAIKLVDGVEDKFANLKIKDNKYEDVKSDDLKLDWGKHKTDTVVNGKVTSSSPNSMSLNNRMASNISTTLRALSSNMSKEQTFCNKLISGMKVALTERNAAYKKALTGAFGYARKNGKKSK